MGSRYREYIPFFDRILDYDGGGYAPARGRGCGCLLALLGIAIVMITLIAPLWMAYTLGSGTWGARGLLFKLYTAVVTLSALAIAGLLMVTGFAHIIGVILGPRGASFSTGAMLQTIVSMALVSLVSLAFIIGFMRRSRSPMPARRPAARTTNRIRPRLRKQPTQD